MKVLVTGGAGFIKTFSCFSMKNYTSHSKNFAFLLRKNVESNKLEVIK